MKTGSNAVRLVVFWVAVGAAVSAGAQSPSSGAERSSWVGLSPETRQVVEQYAEGYKVLMRVAKSELKGQADLRDGFHVVGAHIDSPRIEPKARPLYEREGYALFQTNYHGGIKTYQWTNIPLALMGRVDRKDGSTVWTVSSKVDVYHLYRAMHAFFAE